MRKQCNRRYGWGRPAARALSALLACLGANTARAQPASFTIEQLLKDGWEIAGYQGLAFENRSMILFRHKAETYLVQCSVLYDVTRAQRLVMNCYALR